MASDSLADSQASAVGSPAASVADNLVASGNPEDSLVASAVGNLGASADSPAEDTPAASDNPEDSPASVAGNPEAACILAASWAAWHQVAAGRAAVAVDWGQDCSWRL